VKALAPGLEWLARLIEERSLVSRWRRQVSVRMSLWRLHFPFAPARAIFAFEEDFHVSK
jgi:hypothetical protein